MSKTYKHEYLRYITCPHCGCSICDYWTMGARDLNMDEIINCYKCNNKFKVEEFDLEYHGHITGSEDENDRKKLEEK